MQLWKVMKDTIERLFLLWESLSTQAPGTIWTKKSWVLELQRKTPKLPFVPTLTSYKTKDDKNLKICNGHVLVF